MANDILRRTTLHGIPAGEARRQGRIAKALLLRSGPGDYDCAHQDLYGEHVFPLQVAILPSTSGRAFTGGKLVLTERRPRPQSRPAVVPLGIIVQDAA